MSDFRTFLSQICPLTALLGASLSENGTKLCVLGANLRQIVSDLYLPHPISEKIGAILHSPQTEGEKVQPKNFI
jgi:hypothetical protein